MFLLWVLHGVTLEGYFHHSPVVLTSGLGLDLASMVALDLVFSYSCFVYILRLIFVCEA